MKIDLANVEIRKVETMSDHGLKIILVTPELPAEEMMALMNAKKTCIADNVQFTPVSKKAKTSSQELRNAIFGYFVRLHPEMKDDENEFAGFYEDSIQKLCEYYRNK